MTHPAAYTTSPPCAGRASLDMPGLTVNFSPCYLSAMRSPSSVVWTFLLCSVIPLASCSTARPVPAPVRVAPPVTPTAVQTPPIPGTPVVLAPEDKALGHFLKSQVALNAGDYDMALSVLEHAVLSRPEHAVPAPAAGHPGLASRQAGRGPGALSSRLLPPSRTISPPSASWPACSPRPARKTKPRRCMNPC